MLGTHFETRCDSGRRKAESRCRNHASSAFTLTELLVVITIIAILAGLLLGAVQRALVTGKRTAITVELQQIGAALEDLNSESGAYPPNGMNNGNNTRAVNDFVRMFKKAFPRHKEPDDLILALAAAPGTNLNGPYNVTLPVDADGGQEGGGLTGAEAVFFWLGGFSDDVSYPISGPGGPSFTDADGDGDNNLEASDEVLENRNRRYDFDLSRLGPRTSEGQFDDSSGKGRFITYNDPRVSPPGSGQLRRINLWTYTPGGSSVPAAYFDTSRHTPAEYDLPFSGIAGGDLYALKQLREGVSAATQNSDVRWVEDQKFQLLHPGVDDIWGDDFANFRLNVEDNGANAYQNVLLAPEGPFLGDVADTLGNFMSGTLEDKAE